ncbi:MAG: Na/Pi cotransporter family protein [Erysipelotrichaceae bacterium]|nr:Na/Pi cotransporter family protein [Erysipelotrichaceae bacterium]
MTISWDLIVGGFGLFMFGIKFMGDGLKAVAGDKLRDYIDKYTSKPLMAVAIGAIITCLIQSSSATTAICIGLVRAGLMKLEQAAGIVMGANIGTTITAFIIGLKIEKYALYFVCIGALLLSFSSKKKMRYFGEIILGFGCLFYGLNIMGDALKQLKDLPQFIQVAETMGKQPILGMLCGTIMTGVIQSSSAFIGIVQKIYESGGMTLMAAVACVFGSNIGTTITGVFAALGGSLAAKRTAGLHTLFNVVGTIIAMILIVPYVSLVETISNALSLSPMMQVATAHIIFNVAATLLFFPFMKQMCALVKKIIPGQELERIDVRIDELDPHLAHTLPASALNVAQQAILKMGGVVEENLVETQKFLNSKKPSGDDVDLIKQSESLINSLDNKITEYLMIIGKEEQLTEHDASEQTLDLRVVKDLERIGDLSLNVMEFFEMLHEDNGAFSDTAMKRLNEMYDLLRNMVKQSLAIYQSKSFEAYVELCKDEDRMDILEDTAREEHFARMQRNECTSSVAGSVYCDILGTIERMADHAVNIARDSVEVQPHSINDNQQ